MIRYLILLLFVLTSCSKVLVGDQYCDVGQGAVDTYLVNNSSREIDFFDQKGVYLFTLKSGESRIENSHVVFYSDGIRYDGSVLNCPCRLILELKEV